MLTLIIFLFGLIIGSFLNVCIYRIPRGESVVSPPSSCPNCGNRLRFPDLIPVFSYICLKGRCRTCGNPISFKYPLIELLTGFLFLLMYYRFGPIPQLINYLLLSSILMVVTFIDLEHHLIPNKVLACGAVLQLAVNMFTHQISYIDAGTGFLTGGILLLLIAVISKGGMGGGDIKLAAVLGLFLGWQRVITAFWIAAVMAAVTGLTLIALKKKTRKDAIPFGPFLSAGALAGIIWGRPLLAWYLGIF